MNDKTHKSNNKPKSSQSSGDNTGPGSGNSANKKRNNNRNRNRNRNRSNAPGKGKPNSGNRKFSKNKSSSHRSVKLTGDAKVIAHYDTLLEQHNLARKKYYEFFHRADPNQKDKLESKFITTLEALRTYEKDQYDILAQRIDNLPKDHIYCENNGVDPNSKDDLPVEIIDEHVNAMMKSRPDYSKDTEESSGSIEDYYKYKGLPIPEPKEANSKSDNRR